MPVKRSTLIVCTWSLFLVVANAASEELQVRLDDAPHHQQWIQGLGDRDHVPPVPTHGRQDIQAAGHARGTTVSASTKEAEPTKEEVMDHGSHDDDSGDFGESADGKGRHEVGAASRSGKGRRGGKGGVSMSSYGAFSIWGSNRAGNSEELEESRADDDDDDDDGDDEEDDKKDKQQHAAENTKNKQVKAFASKKKGSKAKKIRRGEKPKKVRSTLRKADKKPKKVRSTGMNAVKRPTKVRGGMRRPCVDRWSTPYSQVTYAKVSHASRCAYYKSLKMCTRRWLKQRCSATCTGKGKDHRHYSRPFSSWAYKTKKYASVCAYYRSRRLCGNRWIRRRCLKTCTRKGHDSSRFRRAYVGRHRIQTGKKTWPSRCSYAAQSHAGRLCRYRYYMRNCKASCKVCRTTRSRGTTRTRRAIWSRRRWARRRVAHRKTKSEVVSLKLKKAERASKAQKQAELQKKAAVEKSKKANEQVAKAESKTKVARSEKAKKWAEKRMQIATEKKRKAAARAMKAKRAKESAAKRAGEAKVKEQAASKRRGREKKETAKASASTKEGRRKAKGRNSRPARFVKKLRAVLNKSYSKRPRKRRGRRRFQRRHHKWEKRRERLAKRRAAWCRGRGWYNAKGRWVRGKWSPPISVGFYGRTNRKEKYQVPPKGCPEECHRRVRKKHDAASKKKIQRHMPTVSAGGSHTCAVPVGLKGVYCWGYDSSKQAARGALKYKDVAFASVSAAYQHTCGVPKAPRTGVLCWGRNGKRGHLGAYKYKNDAFASVSASGLHTCGVTRTPNVAIKCWGSNLQGQCEQITPNRDIVPDSLKLIAEPSCMTSHPTKSGTTSCTSCHAAAASASSSKGKGMCHKGKPCHFTIVDPKTNTGTCTDTPCPACKPSACCGAHHKHFVVNTVSLTGVCVRHTDGCTPVCMPRGESERQKPRVCSKGCNQLLKVDKEFKKGKARPTTNDESKLFDMVVCQADKRVVCKPLRSKTRTSCRTKTTAKAVARCPFDVSVWNLGGTCIASHVHKLKGSPCTTTKDAKLLRSAKCSQGTQRDHIQCSRLAMSF